MSLGPVSNNTSTSRLNQTQRLQETQKSEAPAASTPATAAEGIERTAVDPSIQAGAREATKGIEDAIKGRLEQATDGAAGGSAPRRGLNSLEGEQFVGRRTGKGRRTAAAETGVDKPQLARASGDAPSVQEQSIQLAGKRTTSGTRVGHNDSEETPPLPGMPPQTEFA